MANGTISNTRFIGNGPLLLSDAPDMPSISTGQFIYSYSGITIDQNALSSLSLGSGNTFEDMHFGIRSIRSSINIPSGAVFRGIKTTLGNGTSAETAYPDSWSISSLDVLNGSNPNLAIVGCTFTDCSRGFLRWGKANNISLSNNTFSGSMNTSLQGFFVIGTGTSAAPSTLNIANNTLTNVKQSILVANNNRMNLNIQNNTIANTSGSAASYHPDGIFVSEATAVNSPLPYRIRYNNIDMGSGNVGQRMGIYCRNLPGVKIVENQVLIKEYTTDLPAGQAKPGGIVLDNCNQFLISCNTISANLNNPSTLYWNWTKGISVNGGSGKGIYSNIITNTGIGILAMGNQSSTAVERDILTKSTARFKGIQLQNGQLMSQGSSGVNGNGCSITWNSLGSNDWTAFTFGTITSLTGCTLHVQTVPSPLNITGVSPLFSIPADASGPSNYPTYNPPFPCPSQISSVIPPSDNGFKTLRMLAKDSVYYPASLAYAKTIALMDLYVAFKTDSFINLDTVIAAFADTFKNSIYGQLLDINMSQYTGMDLKTADSLWDWNDTIVAIDSISDILKTVNDFLFSKVSIGESLDSSQLNTLSTIAWLCPFRCGIGVYGARAIVENLDTMTNHYYNCCELQTENCEEDYRLEEKSNNQTQINDKEIYSLYPNPATNEIMFEYKTNDLEQILLNLYSVSGKIIKSFKLDSGIGKLIIDTSEISNGIYFVQVIKNFELVYRQKVCIIK